MIILLFFNILFFIFLFIFGSHGSQAERITVHVNEEFSAEFYLYCFGKNVKLSFKK